MARPPHARERVLDAYEALLITDGERAATLDAVARAAGVSKGGLLYHFASKDDLAAAMIARLDRLATEDIERIRTAPEGPVEYYLRTSVMMDDALDSHGPAEGADVVVPAGADLDALVALVLRSVAA